MLTAPVHGMMEENKKQAIKLAVIMSLAIMLLSLALAAAETQSVSYVNAQGVAQTPVNCTMITADNPVTALEYGWYAIQGNVSLSGKMDVNTAGVNLILCDGCTLEVSGGILVYRSASLTIWAQSTGSSRGKLIATGSENAAGIGGSQDYSAGTI